MSYETFKEFYARSRDPLRPSDEARVRAIRRELLTNKRLTDGERLIIELQLITYELLKRELERSRR